MERVTAGVGCGRGLYACVSVGAAVVDSIIAFGLLLVMMVWYVVPPTAALLLVLLGTHVLVLHYIPENMNIDFVGVAFRFQSAMYFVIDSGLLAASLFHGLNGVRNIAFDYVVANDKRNLVSIILTITGLAFFAWGAYALTFFLK